MLTALTPALLDHLITLWLINDCDMFRGTLIRWRNSLLGAVQDPNEGCNYWLVEFKVCALISAQAYT